MLKDREYVDKRYFSKINGSRYVFSDGTEATFAYGRLDVNAKAFPGTYKAGHKEHPSTVDNGRPKWHVYQDELDAILGSNPIIFTQESLQSLVDQNEPVVQNASTEAEVAKTEANLATAGATKTSQEMGTGTVSVPSEADVSKSTLDPTLLRAAAGGAVVGPGAAAAERIAKARADSAQASVSK